MRRARGNDRTGAVVRSGGSRPRGRAGRTVRFGESAPFLGAALVVAFAVLAATSATRPPTAPSAGRAIRVVAAENFWGSIVGQIGGDRVSVESIITNPAADPHAYEPTSADARAIANARLVVVNGLGYDPWATKLLAADSGSATVLDVGRLLGLPVAANPHRWYDPADVRRVVAAAASDLSHLDPGSRSYFERQARRFETVGLATYHQLIDTIRARFAGTPVGASESIFSMLGPALGLRVLTPPTFLRAISEGSEVSAGDRAVIDRQIRLRLIKIYVFNSQNVTPDVQAQLAECHAEHIPTATITETLAPASSSYESWQVRELRGILAALREVRS